MIATFQLQDSKIKYSLDNFRDLWLNFHLKMTAKFGYRITDNAKFNKVIEVIQRGIQIGYVEEYDQLGLDSEQAQILQWYMTGQLTYFNFYQAILNHFNCFFYKKLDKELLELIKRISEGIEYLDIISNPDWLQIIAALEHLLELCLPNEEYLIQERIDVYKAMYKFREQTANISEQIMKEIELNHTVIQKKLKAAKRTMIAHQFEEYYLKQMTKHEGFLFEYGLISKYYTTHIEN